MSRDTAIRKAHASLNLKTLEALANKGLLRRAQKDLESGAVGEFGITEAGLVVPVGKQQVTLVESGPAKATCDCPAPGVCQHILAACLALLQTEAAIAAEQNVANVRDEWLAFTEETLLKAFPLSVLRSAYEVSTTPGIIIEDGPPLTVRFPWLNAEVHALPSVGIDGIIVHGPDAKGREKLAAAAILFARADAGIVWIPPALTGTVGTEPIHRAQVLDSAIEVLEELTAAGLARITPTQAERLEGLAISATTSELHRLGLLLRRLATQITEWLHRHPQADLAHIFAEMATAYALAHALRNPANTHLEGTPRESYIDIGSLDLTGVAAWPWRTPSGYEGFTLLLWDTQNSAWNTWSDARPLAFREGFNPIGRFHQPGPWDGAASPAQLSRSRFRLLHAKRNRWGRLSSSAQTKALVSGPAHFEGLPILRDWTTLNTQARGASLGLREQDPRSAYQIVQPSRWECFPFDPVQQALVWILRDEQEKTLTLRLPFDDYSRPAIEALENRSEEELQGQALLGQCVRTQSGFQIAPIALITSDKSVSLFLDNIPLPPSVESSATGAQPAEDLDLEDEAGVIVDSAVGHLIEKAIDTCVRLAESGCRSRQELTRNRMEELAHEAQQLQLTDLAEILRTCSNSGASGIWLRARWILHVMQRAA